MKNSKYAKMDLDELFAALEVAAIRQHEAFVGGGPIKRQHQWVAKLNAIYEEIEARGADAVKRFVPLLTSEQPPVRLAAALALHKIAPDLALPVLEELRAGRYGGTIAVNVRMAIDEP